MAIVGGVAIPGGRVATVPGAYPSLVGVGIFDVVTNLCHTDDAIQWPMCHGQLAGSRACRRCPGQVAMVLKDYAEGDGKRWRCPTQGCRSTVSLRRVSFYSNSKLSLRDSIMVNSSVQQIVTRMSHYILAVFVRTSTVVVS